MRSGQTLDTTRLAARLLLLALLAAAPGLAQETSSASGQLLWRDPGNIAAKNLFHGPGDEAHRPALPVKFLKEDAHGHNSKLDVEDTNGVQWKAKVGIEAQPEIAATRLLWAIGYFTNENYFVPDLKVEELPTHLKRGQGHVTSPGHLEGVRLQRAPEGKKKVAGWNWRHNPLTGTREFNGLRVMMALISNWDLKDENNAIFSDKKSGKKKDKAGKNSRGSSSGYAGDGSRGPSAPGCAAPSDSQDDPEEYLVTDLGTAFGASGKHWTEAASKNNLKEYQKAKFIAKIAPEYVDFNFPRRPPLLHLFVLPSYIHQIRMRWVGSRVPRADAKWLGSLLSRLSASQIEDAFRAAGYPPEKAEAFTQVMQARIAELNKL